MPSDFYTRVRTAFQQDQQVGMMKGLDKARALIESRAKFGYCEIKVSDLGNTAVETLRNEGFAFTNTRKWEGDQRDPYEVAYYYISWTR